MPKALEGLSTRNLGFAQLVDRGFNRDDWVLLRALIGPWSNTLKKAAKRGVLAKSERTGSDVLLPKS